MRCDATCVVTCVLTCFLIVFNILKILNIEVAHQFFQKDNYKELGDRALKMKVVNHDAIL